MSSLFSFDDLIRSSPDLISDVDYSTLQNSSLSICSFRCLFIQLSRIEYNRKPDDMTLTLANSAGSFMPFCKEVISEAETSRLDDVMAEDCRVQNRKQ